MYVCGDLCKWDVGPLVKAGQCGDCVEGQARERRSHTDLGLEPTVVLATVVVVDPLPVARARTRNRILLLMATT
jgi:hypothetical protein